jgi:hypothetical protein
MTYNFNLKHASVLRASVAVGAGASDTQIVDAVAGKKIHVIAAIISAATDAGTIVFKSKPAGASAAITNVMTSAVNVTAVLPSAKMRCAWPRRS